METRKSNPAALLPIVVFLVFYLGSGIYFEYINPPEGGMAGGGISSEQKPQL